MKTLALFSLALFIFGPSSSDLDALLKSDQEFSKALIGKSAGHAFSLYMTEDVTLLAPGSQLITGREAASAHIAREPARKISGWQVLRAGVSRGGDLGYTAGAFQFSQAGSEQKTGHAVYLFAWKKERGSWKIASILRNETDEPPAADARRIEAQPTNAGPNTVDVDSEKAAIIKADTDFANLSVATSAPEAFSAYIADDGTILGVVTRAVFGHQAVRSQFPPSPRKGTLDWRPVKADMSVTGDLGYTVGMAEFKGEDAEGKPVTRYTQYLTVWKKQADGSWKFVIDGGNSSPARPGEK